MNKNPRTLSIGGSTFDLFVRTGKDLACMNQGECALLLPLGEKIRVEHVLETCGGGAANTSVGLRRLGCKASFCGVIGSDQWGATMLENLRREGVDTESTTIVEDETSSFSIILSVKSGERVILYAPGTNTHLHEATFDKSVASASDWIYMNHMHERSCSIEDDLLAILSSQESPGLTWNPGGSQIQTGMMGERERKLLRETDLLLLNRDEAFQFTNTSSVTDALRAIVKSGVRFACITDGKNGTFATDGTELFVCPVDPKTRAIDTTGAGDAFGAGATWALLHGKNLQDILCAGTINAASVIEAIGAQAGLLTDIDMQKRLENCELCISMHPLF